MKKVWFKLAVLASLVATGLVQIHAAEDLKKTSAKDSGRRGYQWQERQSQKVSSADASAKPQPENKPNAVERVSPATTLSQSANAPQGGATDPVAATGATLTGRVLTAPGGDPVAGAIVKLWFVFKEAQTGEDGTYLFSGVKQGTYAVEVVEAPGRAPGIRSEPVEIHVGQASVRADDLYLTLPQSISGTVRDAETGQPVAGARFNFSTANRNRSGVSTDSQGRYRLYVEPRDVALHCSGTHDRYYPEGGERDRIVAVWSGGHIRDIDFEVRSAPVYTGHVTFPDGTPAVGVDVDVEVNWVDLSVGAGHGTTFRLKTGAEGTFVGYVRSPMPRRSDEKVTFKAISWLPDRSMGSVTHAETHTKEYRVDPMKLVLADSASVTILLLDPDREPVTDAEVFASDVQPNFNKRHGGPVKHLGDGRYLMSGLIPGLDYYFSAQSPNCITPHTRKEFVLASGEQRDVGTLTMICTGKKAVPGLIERLKSPDPYERLGAAERLGEIDGCGTEAVPALLEMATHPDAGVREGAIRALGRIGPPARAAVPDLIRILEQGDEPGFRRLAAKALGGIRDPRALPALEAALSDSYNPVRSEARYAIRRTEDAKKRSSPLPKLRYEIEPLHSRVDLGGKMVFECRLANESDQTVRVFWGQYAYDDQYRFAITRKDGKQIASPWKRLTPPGAALESKDFREMTPGGDLKYTIYLSPLPWANSQRYYFREPGEYTVRATFVAARGSAANPKTGRRQEIQGAWVGRLEAEPVVVTVKPPLEGMSEGIRLEGRVVDMAGQPLVRARVSVRRHSTDVYSKLGYRLCKVDRQITGQKGRFVFTNLPQDSLFFVVESRCAGYALSKAKVIVDPPKKRYELHVGMNPGVAVRGRVHDSRGRPVEGVRVSVSGGGGRYVYTDWRGRFELLGVTPDEDIYCTVWKSGFVGKTEKASLEKATAGDWTITLLREDDLSSSGRAVFAAAGDRTRPLPRTEEGSPVGDGSVPSHARTSKLNSGRAAAAEQTQLRSPVSCSYTPSPDLFSGPTHSYTFCQVNLRDLLPSP